MSNNYQSVFSIVAMVLFFTAAFSCNRYHASSPNPPPQQKQPIKPCGGVNAEAQYSVRSDCDGGGELVELIERVDTSDPGYIISSPEPDLNEVAYPNSNVFWLRCPLGKLWDGEQCTLHANIWSWKSAQTACPSGYRLPSVNEYQMLLECEDTSLTGYEIKCNQCGYLEFCASLFSADSGWFYTSDFRNGKHVLVNVELGKIMFSAEPLGNHVRCVRSTD